MKKRKRTSVMWDIPIEELAKVVAEKDSMAKVIRHFGLVTASGNYKTLKKRLDEENVDYSHIKLGLNNNQGRKHPFRAIPIEEVMIKNSTYNRGTLKKRLLKEGIIENKCALCGQEPVWQDKKLVMVLDHINGVNDDHRRENLRLLCSNCNSQTSTFAGRTLKKKYNCKKCGIKTAKGSRHELCRKCASFQGRKVKNRPSKEILLKEVKETNYCVVGRKYGVSDNAVRKWLK